MARVPWPFRRHTLRSVRSPEDGQVLRLRFIRRALLEHRRLPRLVRIYRAWQAGCLAFMVCCMLALVIFRAPVPVIYVLLVAATVPLMVSIAGVGLLIWRNYEHTAEIWTENAKGRGLDSAGLGWLVDVPTTRALGAVQALFAAGMVVAVTVQTVGPWVVNLLG